MGVYKEVVLKRLWALSGNRCYYPECDQQMAYLDRDYVLGEIAHICARSPGGQRYDPAVDAHDFPNLVLMCPTHHAMIDAVEPDRWPRERLEKLKARHEDDPHKPEELSGNLLEAVVNLHLTVMVADGDREPARAWGATLRPTQSAEDVVPAPRASGWSGPFRTGGNDPDDRY